MTNIVKFNGQTWVRQPMVWGWPPPDQISNNPDYYEIVNGGKLPRGCTRTSGVIPFLLRSLGINARATGCPGVLLVGEIDNWHNSPAVKLDDRWQFFGAEALAWSEYNQPLKLLDSSQYDNIARAHRALNGDRKALCNNGGFNDPDVPRWDFITPKDEGAELPVRDFYRWMVTVACEILKTQKNKHNQTMGRLNSFVWEQGPPKNYDFTRMDEDSRMCVGTIQYSGGAVGKFPQISKDVYFPFITLGDQPAWYPLAYLQLETARRPYYYPT